MNARQYEQHPARVNGVPDRPPAIVGSPTADEVAAVLAALTHRSSAPRASAYERWRQTRLAARRDRGSATR
jgi:hypothetical protein